ncbi:MAG TPA: SRPBCC family protein [bacterium]|nr:SRPBCC family protein [bacterium]HPN45727.1 SRPBCC family protein [bacterium]
MTSRRTLLLLLPGAAVLLLLVLLVRVVFEPNRGTEMNAMDYTTINANAAAAASATITIAADANSVWNILTDFARWRDWNPAVQAMTINGPVTPGTVFKWQADSAKITSTIQQAQPPYFISWSGKMLGINAIHVWRLTPQDSVTVVHTAESWDGWLVKLLNKPMQKMLQKSLDEGLGYLQAAAEKS